jgi:hypothetical protein
MVLFPQRSLTIFTYLPPRVASTATPHTLASHIKRKFYFDFHDACQMSLYIAGLKGMVGSAIAMEAEAQGLQVLGKGFHELDLLDRLTLIEELLASKLDSGIRFGQNI